MFGVKHADECFILWPEFELLGEIKYFNHDLGEIWPYSDGVILTRFPCCEMSYRNCLEGTGEFYNRSCTKV